MSSLSSPRPPDLDEGDPRRAASILQAMYPVCSHDLPNRMVALRSLVRLIEMDGAAQLPPDLAEYLQRLDAALDKTGVLVDFLKEMSRLQRHLPKNEGVRLASLAAEWKAEVRGRFPQRSIDWQYRAEGDAFRTDRRLLHQAAIAVLLMGLEIVVSPRVSVQMHGIVKDARLELMLSFKPEADEVLPVRLPLVEKRVEYLLAAETLGVLGGTLRCAAEPNGVAFALNVPSSQDHV